MDSDLPPSQQPAPELFFFPGWLPWTVAILLAAVCAWLTQTYFATQAENARLRELHTLSDFELRSARQLLEAERLIANRQLGMQRGLAQFEIFPLSANLGSSPAVAVWNSAQQEGVLQTDKLPALPVGQDYQIWVTDPQRPLPVNCGVFNPDPAKERARIQIHPDQSVTAIAKITVTIGRKGGDSQPTGPVVLCTR